MKLVTEFADLNRNSLNPADINVGDTVKPMDIPLTPTLVAATAIASMDYMPVHHDKDYGLSAICTGYFSEYSFNQWAIYLDLLRIGRGRKPGSKKSM